MCPRLCVCVCACLISTNCNVFISVPDMQWWRYCLNLKRFNCSIFAIFRWRTMTCSLRLLNNCSQLTVATSWQRCRMQLNCILCVGLNFLLDGNALTQAKKVCGQCKRKNKHCGRSNTITSATFYHIAIISYVDNTYTRYVCRYVYKLYWFCLHPHVALPNNFKCKLGKAAFNGCALFDILLTFHTFTFCHSENPLPPRTVKVEIFINKVINCRGRGNSILTAGALGGHGQWEEASRLGRCRCCGSALLGVGTGRHQTESR